MRDLKDYNIILSGYTVDHNGNIYSRKGNLRKPSLRSKRKGCDYYAIGVYYGGKNHTFFTHRLIAFVHCNLDYSILDLNGKVVNHIDGNYHNNHPTNLEWVTQFDNVRKGRKIILNSKKRRTRSTRIRSRAFINQLDGTRYLTYHQLELNYTSCHQLEISL